VEKMTGEGRYGICYLVSDGRQSYIFKQLKRSMLRKAREKAVFEQEILMSLNNQHIPRFIRKIEEESLCGYLLEFKEGTTFEDLLYTENRIFLTQEIHYIGMQIICILKYLHRAGVVHRDIRVPNTLHGGYQVYLVDFGLARWIDDLKYPADIDFAYLGDFLLHLYYSSYGINGGGKKAWHQELNLRAAEMLFLKKLLGIEKRFRDIDEVEEGFLSIVEN
jgi:serine/threonine-protein kinase